MTLLQDVQMKKGLLQPDPVWYLSEAGRHNLMTRSTGATARAILDKIEDEK
ncbi:hypothetical protein [Ottowia thiooxydans]|uniref:hypothetical protein n=1 Tax=Ottowia thiooxydans TaxID=219182 RepID=UPI0012EBB27B|nr:hypothetical protein [Ottowia thiooxydans]